MENREAQGILFSDFMRKSKKEKMKKDMISSVQIRSGLDDMPSKYSQNARK